MNDIISKEIASLVAIGDKLAVDAAVAGNNLPQERVQQLLSISARGGQLITRLYGADSHDMKMFQVPLKYPYFKSMHSNCYNHVSEVVGILKAVEHDINTGMLLNFRSLLQAEIFSDFLEMAEHLLREGYKDAAAVILGTVLEDSLRKISDSNSIAIVGTSGKQLTIDPLNIEPGQSWDIRAAGAKAGDDMGQSSQRCSSRSFCKVRRSSGSADAFICTEILR